MFKTPPQNPNLHSRYTELTLQQPLVTTQTPCHLIVIAFYFLLRVGEYALPPEHRTTRTVLQFRICDFRFWQGQTLLPPTSNATILAAASSVTLIMDNQKNVQRGDVIHQEAVNGNFCPVRSTAARISAILAQDMPLMTPTTFVQPRIHVQSPHILHAVRRRAKLVKLIDSGYSLSQIGAHLLHASGAMALWLFGHGPEAIMKLDAGRLKPSSPTSTPKLPNLPGAHP
jgi:hypothetical protein